MRIMLANPQSASNLYRQFGGNLPPLGLTYLAAVLRLDGHQVQIADLEVESDRKINFSSFDVIGITAFTPQYNNAVRLAREAKKEGITVVMGGYHVSFQSQEALSTGVVDFVVRGEGENSFRNLINCLESGGGVGEIPGISYLENGRCVRTPPAPLEADLDRMPLPARDLLPLNKYPNELCRRRATSVITSRGCPFNCSFCICSKMGGLKWRTRSTGSIIAELTELKNKYGYSAVFFTDDNFTLKPERVVELSEEMSKRRLDMYWWCFSRADTIVRNEYMVKKMADAGARTVFLGIESANHEILDEYNKKTTLRQLHQAFEILRDHKIKTWGSFVIGGLNETKKMIKNTVQLAKRLNPDTVQFSILTPYPGTKLFESVKSRIAFRNWDLYDGAHAIMPTKHLTPAELQKSIVKAYSRFYLRFSKLPGVFAYIKSRNLRVGNIFKTLLHIWQIKRSYMAENKYRKPERESWI